MLLLQFNSSINGLEKARRTEFMAALFMLISAYLCLSYVLPIIDTVFYKAFQTFTKVVNRK